MTDKTDALAMLSLQGPLSRDILAGVIDSGLLPEPVRNSLSIVTINGRQVLLARTGYTGEPLCFELFISTDDVVTVWDMLIDRGARPIGLGARDTLRLEAGLPLYGHEFGLDPEQNEIPVESVYYNGYPGTTQTWIEFSEAVTTAGLSLIQAQYPDTYSWGGITVIVLNPVAGMVNPEQNEASVVLRIDYAQSSVLLPADIDSSVEDKLPNRASTLQADVLKIAHHGSKHSTSETFLDAVLPQEAVISVGPNSYGHPAIETISRLDASGVGIWRTDAIGTILLSTDGESIEMLPKLAYLPFTSYTFKTTEVIE